MTQSKLTERLANQFKIDIIRFRYHDCLLFHDGEVLKMFAPQSKRVLGGTSLDRMIIGDLTFALKNDMKKLRPPSLKFERPKSIFGCPIANFPWLTQHSLLSDVPISNELIEGIGTLLDSLPDNAACWRERFGDDFFSNSAIDRCARIVPALRSLEPNPV